jgi:hypothetical protein
MCPFSKDQKPGNCENEEENEKLLLLPKNLCKGKKILYSRLKLSISYAILRKSFHEKF